MSPRGRASTTTRIASSAGFLCNGRAGAGMIAESRRPVVHVPHCPQQPVELVWPLFWRAEYDYATCNLSFTSHIPVLTSGHFIWTTLNWVSCFLVFPRSRLKRQSQCVTFASGSQHVSLSDFRGNSCFVIFNVGTCNFGDSAQSCEFGCFVVTASRCLVQIPREALLHNREV